MQKNLPLRPRSAANRSNVSCRWTTRAGDMLAKRLRHSLRVVLLLSMAATTATAQQVTSNDEDACKPDVFRVCSAFIPDVERITACLKQNVGSLIPTVLTVDLCPLPCSQGCHPFGIADECVPGGAAGLYDLLVGVPNGVSEIVAPQIFPNVLDRIKLRGIGRQSEQDDIVRHRQALAGLMPACAIADQNAVAFRVDGLADLGEVDAHDFATDPWHHHSGTDGSFRANRSEQPCRIVPIVADHRRA